MTRTIRSSCVAALVLAVCATAAFAQTDTTGAASGTAMSTPHSTMAHAKRKVHRRRKKAKTTKTGYKAAAVEKEQHRNKTPHAFVSRVNLNTASREELMRLPDVSGDMADKIIAGRPFGSTKELVAKGILTDDEYKKLSHQVSTKIETK